MVVQCSLISCFMWLTRCLLMWALLLPWTHAQICRNRHLKSIMLATTRLLAPLTHLAVLNSGVSAALLSVQYVSRAASGHMTVMFFSAWSQFAHQVGRRRMALESTLREALGHFQSHKSSATFRLSGAFPCAGPCAVVASLETPYYRYFIP